jgi:hypothetical protein
VKTVAVTKVSKIKPHKNFQGSYFSYTELSPFFVMQKVGLEEKKNWGEVTFYLLQ